MFFRIIIILTEFLDRKHYSFDDFEGSILQSNFKRILESNFNQSIRRHIIKFIENTNVVVNRCMSLSIS